MFDVHQAMLAHMMAETYPDYSPEPEPEAQSSEEITRLSKEVSALKTEVQHLRSEVNRQCTMTSRLMNQLSQHFSSDERVLRDIAVALEGLKR